MYTRMSLPGGWVLPTTDIPPSSFKYGGMMTNQWKGEIADDARTHMEGDNKNNFGSSVDPSGH